MSLRTFNPSVKPSPGTEFKPKVSVHEIEFGDGYTQSTPKGINNIKEVVSLRWDALTYEQMFELKTFFREMTGTKPFYYSPYGAGETLKWTCKDWSHTVNDGVWKFQAKLTQSFTAEV